MWRLKPTFEDLQPIELLQIDSEKAFLEKDEARIWRTTTLGESESAIRTKVSGKDLKHNPLKRRIWTEEKFYIEKVIGKIYPSPY